MFYVMSDIHGNLRRFRSVMEQINLQPEDTLYVLGDVVDRHPHGIEILQEIMAMPNAKMLLGNHEHMMLNALVPRGQTLPWKRDGGIQDLLLWYDNHGEVTEDQWVNLQPEEKQNIIEYLVTLPLNADLEVNGKQYKLVHGSPVDFYRKDNRHYLDCTQFTVWDRIEENTAIPEEYTLIFGHTPTVFYSVEDRLRIWYGQNRIGIDCGSGFDDLAEASFPHQGCLACLRLDDMKEFYSEENSGESEPG